MRCSCPGVPREFSRPFQSPLSGPVVGRSRAWAGPVVSAQGPPFHPRCASVSKCAGFGRRLFCGRRRLK
eukprot:11210630-Lingulodinium_polyedra.AAC.1